MNAIVEILCRRDGLSVSEAVKRVNEVREMLADNLYDYDSAEAIVAEELGLEMDYIFDLI